MTTPCNQVVLHVDATTRPDDLAFLRNMLTQIAGVVSVRPSARPQLTHVDYDPVQVQGRAILDHVRQFGVRARLIGL